MTHEIPDHRALQLMIRRSEAQERLLERRLERVADDQARARRTIHDELGREVWTGLLG